jgi:hypothetical protein
LLIYFCGEGGTPCPCLRPRFWRMGPSEDRPSGFLITCTEIQITVL